MGRQGSLQYRIERQVQFDTNGGCWLWDGSLKSSGYGCVGLPKSGVQIPAHRASWMVYRGPIPDGLQLCHKCDVRECVNPDHLFLGTQKDNIHDMIRKGRQNQVRGSASPNAKLSEVDVVEILSLRGYESALKLAKKYGVVARTIHNIWTRKIWRHV